VSEDNQAVESDSSTFIPVGAFEMVIFGATGDLARRKIFPALYHRFVDGQIPESSRLIGVSRSQHSREEFQKLVYDNYCEFEGEETLDKDQWAAFIDLVDYVSVDVKSEKDWPELAKVVGTSEDLIRVFYLAMPPSMFAGICQGLKSPPRAPLWECLVGAALEKRCDRPYRNHGSRRNWGQRTRSLL